MTKNTLTIVRDTFASLTNRTAEQEEAYQAICAELAKNAEKAAANRALYAEAHDVVIDTLRNADTALTVKELFEQCEEKLPEGFSQSKMQYALLNYWNGEVVKNSYGHGIANTYRIA